MATKKAAFPRKLLDPILAQAEKEYPHECCGFIFSPAGKAAEPTRVQACRNVQNDYHAKDPSGFPRTAETAYFIEPRDLLKMEKEARQRGEALRIIYHSHVNAGAYFSDEDKRNALYDGIPVYPGVDYLVVSVRNGKAEDWKLFSWNEASRDFLPLDFNVTG